MRNKILVVEQNQNDQEKLEEILHSIVQNGGELFFAKERQVALAIIQHEHPQLVFVAEELVGDNLDAWRVKKSHLVVLQKPLQRQQILEECLKALTGSAPPAVPPM